MTRLENNTAKDIAADIYMQLNSRGCMLAPEANWWRCHRILSAYEIWLIGGEEELREALDGLESPASEAITAVIIEPGPLLTIHDLDDYRTLVEARFCKNAIVEINTFHMGESGRNDRILVYFCNPEPIRRHMDRIPSEYNFLLLEDERNHRLLQREMDRNKRVEAEVTVSEDVIAGTYLLWSDLVSSYVSYEEVERKLSPEIVRVSKQADVEVMLLFIESDRDFTTDEERSALIRDLSKLVECMIVAVNIRTRPSAIRFLTCRCFLAGEPWFLKGRISEGSDRSQEVLLEKTCIEERDVHDRLVVASCDWKGDLTLSVYKGFVHDHHFFDADTAKLQDAFGVEDREDLLLALLDLSRTRSESPIDQRILDYCNGNNIHYQSEYYYQ